MLGGGVEVAHFTLAERTLFWINTLLSGHGPEAVASRAEKYRTAHHCDIVVESEEGISCEWLKEDYEITQVECYNREQKEPGLVELSYSCKPGNYGGLLEGVVVLELQVCTGSDAVSGDNAGPVPPTRQVLPSEAPSSAASREVGARISNATAASPEMVLTRQTAGPVRSQSRKRASAAETGHVGQTPGSVLGTTPAQSRATETGATTENMPQGAGTEKPVPACLPPSSDAPLITSSRSSSSVLSIWRRWCPARRPSASSSSSAIAASPAAASCKETAGAGPDQAPSQCRSGAISKLPELVTASSAVLPGHSGDKAQHLDAALRGNPVASHASDWARYGGERFVGDRAGPPVAAPVAPAAPSRGTVPALQDVRADTKSTHRHGFCTIYFSVDALAGNRYGVCCVDDFKTPTPTKLAGPATVSSSELPWWLQGVCTRRHGKVERQPSKVACWRAATAAGNGDLNRRSRVFGANERMQPQREDCMGVSISAEMTSCMDATLKVKLQLAEVPAPSAVVSVPAETGACTLEPVTDAEQRSCTEAAPLALLHHPMEHPDGMADLPASDPAEPSALGVTADEVVLDVSRPGGTGAQSDERDAAPSERTGQPGDAKHADKGSPNSLPNPWEALQPSSSDPWEGLRSALQPPNFVSQALQSPSFMTQVWYVSPPAQPALTAVISPESEPLTSRIESIGSDLLAVASAPPLMTQSMREAPDKQDAEALQVGPSNGATSQLDGAALDPIMSARLRTDE